MRSTRSLGGFVAAASEALLERHGARNLLEVIKAACRSAENDQPIERGPAASFVA